MSIADRHISQALSERRKLEEFPKLQVGFIDTICSPVFQVNIYFKKILNPID